MSAAAWQRTSGHEWCYGYRSPVMVWNSDGYTDEYRVEVLRCDADEWAVFVQSRFLDEWHRSDRWHTMRAADVAQVFTHEATTATGWTREHLTYPQAMAAGRRLAAVIDQRCKQGNEQ